MNFGRLLDWLDQKATFWAALPLSLAGRIAIKMIVLPQFLYLFVNIPIPLTKAFFSSLCSAVIPIVWAGRQPHVSWEIITRPFSVGGLGAPDFELYALCAQAQFLQFWVHPIPFQPNVTIESDIADPTPLHVAVYKPFSRTATEINTVETLRWDWEGLRKRVGTPMLYAPSTPVAHHPHFPFLNDRGSITRALGMGVSTLGDLYPRDTFLEQPQQQGDTPMPLLNLFLYFQLHATCKAIHPTFPAPPDIMKPLEHLLTTPSPQRLITRLYNLTQSITPWIAPKALVQWRIDLEELTDR